jgi:hypothetical protein
MTVLRLGVWVWRVPSIGVLWLALLPSKRVVCMAELVSTVIARRVVDKLDVQVGSAEAICWRKGILFRKVLAAERASLPCALRFVEMYKCVVSHLSSPPLTLTLSLPLAGYNRECK